MDAVSTGLSPTAQATPQSTTGGLDPLVEDADRAFRSAELLRRLTPRQCDVLRLIVLGQSNGKIAAALDLEVATVKMHRAALLERLGTRKSADAVRIAVEASFADTFIALGSFREKRTNVHDQ